MSRRRAFTLIETLIAIGIGSAVAYVAMQAFRVAAQCATASRRLSVENAIMRAGCARAHEQLDYWVDLDDPDGGAQPMRAAVGGEGLPFAPFKDVLPAAAGPREHERGWDDGYKWPANDPRAWWRGDLVESSWTDLRHGRYAIYSSTEPSLDLPAEGGIGVPAYGTVAVGYSWLPGQIHDLFKALQYYGAIEYLPANAMYGYYAPRVAEDQPWTIDGATNAGGIPFLLARCNSRFVNSDGGQVTVRGLWRLTQGSGYGIARPDGAGGAAPASLVDRNGRLWYIGWSASEASLREFLGEACVPRALLPVLPSTWPDGAVSTTRYIKSRRFVAMNAVRWRSPLTGETSTVYFSGYSTSLRGARRQRHRDGGWARWDDVGSSVDPTLDSP